MIDHPDDLAARLALAAGIRARRTAARLSQHGLARRLGVVQTAVNYFEHGDNPHIGTAQRYARATGHRLTLSVHGLPEVVDGMVTAYRRLAINAADPVDADGYHRAAVLEHLRVVRLDSGLSARALAAVVGCTGTAVCLTERGRDNPLLATYQRYARGLGGWLGVTLEPLDQPEPEETT